MKKLFVLIVWMNLAAGSFQGLSAALSASREGGEEIVLYCSPGLKDLGMELSSAYVALHPEARIRLSDENADNQGGIGLVTREQIQDPANLPNLRIVVGRDILVPVISDRNPYKEIILRKGISQAEFVSAFEMKGRGSWEVLVGKNATKSLNIWMVTDEESLSELAHFLKQSVGEIEVNKAGSTGELLEILKKDACALAFCRLVNITDTESRELLPGLSLVPIDVSGNHMVDYFEDIYSSSGELNRGVWIGKYPKGLFSSIYVISRQEVLSAGEQAFIEWMLTDGQKWMGMAGYSGLVSGEMHTRLQSLYASQKAISPQINEGRTGLVFFISSMSLVAVFLLYLVIKLIRSGIHAGYSPVPGTKPVFRPGQTEAPAGFYFNRSHTWAFMEKDGLVKTGIDDFLQGITGEITRIEMKKPGEKLKKGEVYMSIVQHGKKLDIYSPLSGVVSEFNPKLGSEPSLLNHDPYFSGWVYSIEPTDWLKEIKSLLMIDQYRSWLKSEYERLKSFFVERQSEGGILSLKPVLQEGGEIKYGILENMGPDVWEEFQSGFLNTQK